MSKSLFCMRPWKLNSCTSAVPLSIFQEIATTTNIWGLTNIIKTSRFRFQLAFMVNQRLSLHYQNHSCVWYTRYTTTRYTLMLIASFEWMIRSFRGTLRGCKWNMLCTEMTVFNSQNGIKLKHQASLIQEWTLCIS